MKSDTKAGNPKKQNRLVRAGRAVTGVLLALVIVLVGYLAVCRINAKVPMLFGRSMLTVVSPSMEPTLPTGSRILIKSVSDGEIAEGDIITFYVTDKSSGIYGMPNTHRVVSVSKAPDGTTRYVTKGDNNSVNDTGYVLSEDVIGKYVKTLTFFSGLSWLIDSKLFYFILIIIPAAIFFVFEVLNVIKTARGTKAPEGEDEAEPENSEPDRAPEDTDGNRK